MNFEGAGGDVRIDTENGFNWCETVPSASLVTHCL